MGDANSSSPEILAMPDIVENTVDPHNAIVVSCMVIWRVNRYTEPDIGGWCDYVYPVGGQGGIWRH